MIASVDVTVNDGEVTSLWAGAVIGRTLMAALHLDDPGISEAHAIVSLRGTTLRLLSLRGRFSVRGRVVGDTILQPGLEITLAPGVVMRVHALSLPPYVFGLSIDGGSPVVPPPVSSIIADQNTLTPGLSPDADGVIWFSDGACYLRASGQADRRFSLGDVFEVAGRRYTLVAVPLAESAIDATQAEARFAAPMRLVVRYDTIHVWRDAVVVTIDGIPARIISELALIGAPVEWQTVAREVWPEEPDLRRLRMNWDATVARLRLRLKEGAIRPDLVRAAGSGRLELFLGPDDTIEDAS